MNLIDHRLLIVGGKGGVGRTTVATLLALWAERAGKRVLLCQTHSRERLTAWLGIPCVDEKIRWVKPNLAVVNMTPEHSLREYGTQVLRSEFVAKQVLENRIARRFLKAVPGLDYYAMLGKTWFHTTEEEHGRPKWDLVVLDGPATGHLLSMLDIPRGIISFVSEGPLVGPARQMVELLQDPKRARLVLVAIPEELPVTEGIELFSKQQQTVRMELGAAIVNRMEPRIFSPESVEWLDRGPNGNLSPVAQVAWQSGREQAERHDAQERQVFRFAEALQMPVVTIEKRIGMQAWHPESLNQASIELEKKFPTAI